MRELSIFVDESGDFGDYESHCPFYIFTLIFHDQKSSITNQIKWLEEKLDLFQLKKSHCFHTGPIIRKEEDYRNYEIPDRRKLLNMIVQFTKNVDIKYKSIYIEKKNIKDSLFLTISLSKQLSNFINSNLEFFQQFDKIILYYDNGQIELNKILASVFYSTLNNVEFRKVLPADYRLFQVADLICSLELIKLKKEKNILSKAETIFFGRMEDLRKNYLKVIEKKKFE